MKYPLMRPCHAIISNIARLFVLFRKTVVEFKTYSERSRTPEASLRQTRPHTRSITNHQYAWFLVYITQNYERSSSLYQSFEIDIQNFLHHTTTPSSKCIFSNNYRITKVRNGDDCSYDRRLLRSQKMILWNFFNTNSKEGLKLWDWRLGVCEDVVCMFVDFELLLVVEHFQWWRTSKTKDLCWTDQEDQWREWLWIGIYTPAGRVRREFFSKCMSLRRSSYVPLFYVRRCDGTGRTRIRYFSVTVIWIVLFASINISATFAVNITYLSKKSRCNRISFDCWIEFWLIKPNSYTIKATDSANSLHQILRKTDAYLIFHWWESGRKQQWCWKGSSSAYSMKYIR